MTRFPLLLLALMLCRSESEAKAEPKPAEPKPTKPVAPQQWCYDKPNVKPAAWVCADSELACYKSLAQTRFDMRFPHGQDGPNAWSPADPFAIFCVEKKW